MTAADIWRLQVSMTRVEANDRLSRWQALLAFAVLHIGAAALGLWLARGDAGIATLWPSNALLLAILLSGPSRSRASFLALAFLSSTIANLTFGNSAGLSLALSALNVIEPALLWWLLSRSGRRFELFNEPQHVARYAAHVAVPVVGCALLAAIAVGGLANFRWSSALAWFGGDYIAYLLLVPIALGLFNQRDGGLELETGRTNREVVAHAAGLVIITSVVFGQTEFPLLFACIVAQVLTTLRLGATGAILSLAVITVIGTTETLLGFGPVALIRRGAEWQILFLQFYLLAAFLTSMPLAALLRQRALLLAEARRSERQFKRVIENSGEVIFETDLRGRWRFLNPAWEQLTGLDVASSIGDSFVSLIVEEDRQKAVDAFGRLSLDGEHHVETEFRFHSPDGMRWVAAQSRLIEEDGIPTGACGILHDITDRREAEERSMDAAERVHQQHEVLSLASLVAQVGHWRIDLVTGVAEISEEAGRLLMLEPGRHPMPADGAKGYIEEDRETVRAALARGSAGEEFQYEARVALSDGSLRHIYCRGIPEPDWDGGVCAIFGVVRDVTSERQNEAALQQALEEAERMSAENLRIARTDELTGLPNRRHFLDLLRRSIATGGVANKRLALAIFDIDHFKKINDTHGHDGGDAVLRAVSDCAARSVRRGVIVGRLGGEEFGVLLAVRDLQEAREACNKLRTDIARRLVQLPASSCCSVTVSIGLAIQNQGELPDILIKRADLALYDAKSSGRNCLQLAA